MWFRQRVMDSQLRFAIGSLEPRTTNQFTVSTDQEAPISKPRSVSPEFVQPLIANPKVVSDLVHHRDAHLIHDRLRG